LRIINAINGQIPTFKPFPSKKVGKKQENVEKSQSYPHYVQGYPHYVDDFKKFCGKTNDQ